MPLRIDHSKSSLIEEDNFTWYSLVHICIIFKCKGLFKCHHHYMEISTILVHSDFCSLPCAKIYQVTALIL